MASLACPECNRNDRVIIIDEEVYPDSKIMIIFCYCVACNRRFRFMKIINDRHHTRRNKKENDFT